MIHTKIDLTQGVPYWILAQNLVNCFKNALYINIKPLIKFNICKYLQ